MVNELLCKEFWLERIPPEIRLLISPFMNLLLEDIAKQAYSISELLAKNKTSFSAAIVNLPSLASLINQLPLCVPSVQPSSSISTPIGSAILLCRQEITKELAAIRAERNSRSCSRSPAAYRDRPNISRTRGRRDTTPPRAL